MEHTVNVRGVLLSPLNGRVLVPFRGAAQRGRARRQAGVVTLLLRELGDHDRASLIYTGASSCGRLSAEHERVVDAR